MSKIKIKMFAVFTIIFALCLGLDQFTKYLAIGHLKGGNDIVLIDGVLELQYLENRGAAFGLLQNQKFFLLFVGLIFLAILVLILIKLPEHKKYNKLYYLAGAMMAGAIGNMIDRIRFDFVVDFIYFSLIDFPIFNVADIYITLSVIILAIIVLFVYKEEDFEFLSFKQKKYRELK